MDLKTLKFLCGHAGGILPAFQRVHIYEGDVMDAHGNYETRVQVNNGRYCVDVPGSEDLPLVTVNAEKLASAWSVCDGDPTFRVTDASLIVAGKARRARIGLADPKDYPRSSPTPKTSHTAPGVSDLIKRLQPFVATDASKVWATGICLHNGFAYATNNVILCRAPFPAVLPEKVIIPSACFDAVIGRGEPVDMGVSPNHVTFYFEDGVWIRTLLVEGDWPTHVVDNYVNSLPDDWATPHERMGAVLEAAVKIADMRIPVVEFHEGGLKLLDETFEADDLDLPEQGKLNARMASLVFEHADSIQWHVPRQDAHAFRSGDIIGLFGGQR